MLNHVPVFGTIFGLGLLAFASWRNNDAMKKAALGALVIVALVAVPVYLTGEPAEDVVEALPGVSKAVLEQHESAAVAAFSGILALGIGAFAGLLLCRNGKPVPRWVAITMLLASVVVGGLMAWTAGLGGQVRHSEIRASTGPASTGHVDRD